VNIRRRANNELVHTETTSLVTPQDAMSFQISSVKELPDANAELERDVDHKDGSSCSGNVVERKANNADLTLCEREELKKCEELIAVGLGTFFEVGNALLTLRQKRLYRVTHPTFESYCIEKWQIGRSYASRMIGAAERILLLRGQTELAPPVNECQIRPFLRLAPEQFPQAWRRAAELSGGRTITGKFAQTIVDEISPPKAVPRQAMPAQTPHGLPLGQILVLLHRAKKEIQAGIAEPALEYLERIEQLLFGGEIEMPIAGLTLLGARSTHM
jgi:hypothetical protein